MTGQTVKQDTPEFDAPVEETGTEIVSGSKKAPGAFRTISEVADELHVQQHVLRFWETKFAQIKPLKRGGGRRYYRPEDVLLLKKIHTLLYTEGYTIKGVQKLLKTQGKAQLLADVQPQAPVVKRQAPANETASRAAEAEPAEQLSAVEISDKQRSILQAMLGDLRDLRNMIAVDK
jgi:DNA-binding transcriptional MerR regulator